MVGIRQTLTFLCLFFVLLTNVMGEEIVDEFYTSPQVCTDPKYTEAKFQGIRCVPFYRNEMTGEREKIRVVFPNEELRNEWYVDVPTEQRPTPIQSQNETGERARAGQRTPPEQTDLRSTASDSSAAQAGEFSNIVSAYEQCSKALDITRRCCQRPETCLGESVGADGSQNSIILGVVSSLLGVAGQYASISGACGDMKKVALGVSGINLLLAGKCTSKVNQCRDACREVATQAQVLYNQCRGNAAACGLSGTASTDVGEVANARAQLQEIARSKDSCTANENAAQQQIVQATSSALTAQLMGLCKKAATSPTPETAAGVNPFNLDCSSPANASSPACQNMCNRAGAQNDPACNPGGLGGLNFGDGGRSGLVDPNSKLGNSALDEFELGQSAIPDANGLNASKISSSTPGGGANLPGGGGGGGGLGGFAAGGGGDGGGGISPAGIGNSIRSGSGYVNPQGRGPASAGGAGGYAGGKQGANGKAFNPKDYLPGGPLDPKRKLAGLASSTPEIGAVHGDIFRSITNRFYQICLRDGLYDCATLRKSGTQGN